jgi:predicted transcriptional regulator
MNTQSDKSPTAAECRILDAIWQLESATVRQVFDHLSSQRKIGYTTVLKFMQIMISKGLLVRDTSVRPQVYRVAKPREETQQGMLKSLIRQVFRNSPGELVLQALSLQVLSLQESTPQQIAEIRKRLDQMESASHR